MPGGNSAVLEDVEEPRDLVLLQVSNAPIVGEGRGVISSMAAICGEEITDPGERDPAVE